MDRQSIGVSPTLEPPLVRVGPARVADAQAALSLYRKVLDEGCWFITERDEFTGTLAWQRRVIADFQRRDNAAYFVARSGTKLVGVLTLQGGHLRRMAHVVKLEIFIDQAERGTGIGKKLMDAGMSWAESHPRITKIGLAVFQDNERAVAMYRAYGFEIEGQREVEYREADGTLRSDLLMYRCV